jgi:hypothetical protein
MRQNASFALFFSVIGIATLLLSALQVFLTAELLGDSYQYICYVHPGCPEPLLFDRISTYFAYFLVHKLAYLINNSSLSFRIASTFLFLSCALAVAASTSLYLTRGKVVTFFVALILFCVLPGVTSTFSSLYPTAISTTLLSIIFLILCLASLNSKALCLINIYFALFVLSVTLLVISKSTSFIPGLFIFVSVFYIPHLKVLFSKRGFILPVFLFIVLLALSLFIFFVFLYDQGNLNLVLEATQNQYFGRYGSLANESLFQFFILRIPPFIFFLKEPLIFFLLFSAYFIVKYPVRHVNHILQPILYLQIATAVLYFLQLFSVYILTARSGPPILNYISEPIVLMAPALAIIIKQSLRNLHLLIAFSSILFTMCMLGLLHHVGIWPLLQVSSMRESALYQIRLSNLMIIPLGLSLVLRRAKPILILPSKYASIGLALFLFWMSIDISFAATHEMLWRRNLAYLFDHSSSPSQLFHSYPSMYARKNYLRYFEEHHSQRSSIKSLYPH